MKYIEFDGATLDTDEVSGERIYAPRGKFCVNADNIGGFYDHTLLLLGHKIRVMQGYEEIRKKIAPRTMEEAMEALRGEEG